MTTKASLHTALAQLGIMPPKTESRKTSFATYTPVDGSLVGHFELDTQSSLAHKVERAQHAQLKLRSIPAPVRGQCIRNFGNLLRKHKESLAFLVTYESGKIYQEALGEVQEMIDVCDFAVGLSRQLSGLTMASERSSHRMMEQWHPLGPIGVISAFNFPVAVWAWNTCLAVVCGDSVIWKPSPQAPLCALACDHLLKAAAGSLGDRSFADISQVVLGNGELGAGLADDPRVPLISATGSTKMGREVAARVARRLGRSLLELGGNNAMIVAESARLDLALRAIVFSAVGTAGQRCTSLRRLFVHRSRLAELTESLVQTYQGLRIGSPLDQATHMGPLVHHAAAQNYFDTLAEAQKEGGRLLYGGTVHPQSEAGGAYVLPAIVAMPTQTAVMHNECFAPLLYLCPFDAIDEAINMQNAVPQGLSSSIFTESMREAELFLSPEGSDCGIANVNIGTSGAEIGGAFGGEKDTGGGRESGSDAWKNYMRRTTNTINYGTALPLAQGIEFNI